MARGRQQSWTCKDCKSVFCVQGHTPKFCCICGSENIGRAPSYDLAIYFGEKRTELMEVCEELNQVYQNYSALKTRYDAIIAYWKQQRRRGYITAEEYEELASSFVGAHPRAEKKASEREWPESSDSCGP